MDEIEEVKEEKEEVVVDKVVPSYSDCLYGMKEIMTDHHLTLEQTFYILCLANGIECDVSPNDENALFNKNLIKSGRRVNKTLLFHLKADQQLSLDMNFETAPIGSDFTLDIADRIEKRFTSDELLSDVTRKKVADRYFKGDLTISRYFIIFRSLFPVSNIKRNSKWNLSFGFIYGGIDLWDSNQRVARKLAEIYRKKDIGIFLESAFTRVKNSLDIENERCFMTKPYKFLLSFEDIYDEVEEGVISRMDARVAKAPLEVKHEGFI